MKKHGLQFAAGLLAVLLVWALSLGRPWHAMEFKTFDFYTSLTAPRVAPVPVVILAIDEPTFQELQTQWPFPRRFHARVIERVLADGAAAIGFDVVFAEPSNRKDDEALANAIAGSGKVVLAASREMVESGNATIWTDVRPIQPLLDAGAIAGFAGVVPDDDFVVRWHEWRDDGFASRLAALGALHAGRLLPPNAGTARMIEYAGPRGTFDTLSYYQALVPGLLPPGFFKDKIVLVGRSVRTASELRNSQVDMFNSPFAVIDAGDRLFPGVEVQANLLSNQITGGGLQPVPDGPVIVITLLLVLLLLYSVSNAHPATTAALALAMIASVIVVSLLLFVHEKRWLPPLFPVAAIIAAYGISGLMSYALARRRAMQIRTMFSQYVPSQVVAKLVEQPEMLRLGGEVREVTLMFTDLANFTTMSEQLSAEQTVEVLTEYFNAMTPIIHRDGGTVDKFIGDAIMAFWGAPLADDAHAQHAVDAAVDMLAAMDDLMQRLRARGLPEIAMRIGIHTGKVVVGNVGSESRFSYTAIGDAVNLAARLEGANKAFGSSILISEETVSRLSDRHRLRHLDVVIVKGKTEPVGVFTPCEDAALCELSARALEAFRSRRWKESVSAFEQILARKPGDAAATRLLERVAVAAAHADTLGAQWNGAISLDKF
ncbi:MAG TPA: adenylate/guanylate cyclase domain-containing protein [Noviherbaspirillum sp.]|jgi:adenylate cyclase|uniref:CHASE2 domain-containing protein n=1 Tax=Noviherbaspirillum sp. TaxID=1926288 RepID=UPI002DDDAD8D|nr:adenylate/guanylate cyclase domain-containing protein [Noviherbaspirillum sp.]HEV2611923.1 adenylate/guanylate cyclase domain-containing protein [Noviherbaspirillum sp.]